MPFEHGCSGTDVRRALQGESALEPNSTLAGPAVTSLDTIAVHLDTLPGGVALEAVQRRGRTLLNLEKITFSADDQGLPPGLLLLQARREGVHRDGPSGGSSLLYYNIGARCILCALHVVSLHRCSLVLAVLQDRDAVHVVRAACCLRARCRSA